MELPNSSCYSMIAMRKNSTIAMRTLLDLFGRCPLFLEDRRQIERRRRINRPQAEDCSTSSSTPSSQRPIKRKFRALADHTDAEEQSADWNQYAVIDLDVCESPRGVARRIRTCTADSPVWSSNHGGGGGGGGS